MRSRLKNTLILAVLLLPLSCSKVNEKAPYIDPASGKHPSGWALPITGGAHTGKFLAGPSACYECHGKDLTGGISKVSCFSSSIGALSCHAGGPSGHPAGWADPDSHGAAAKAVSNGQNGFAHCQVCHGSDFTGGIAKKSCLNTVGCHGAGKMAAHSPRPWRDVGRTGARTHASADASNIAACALCHSGGANSNRKPSAAAPVGTPPGCFNNTLCHGVEGHNSGWASSAAHGAAAKAAAGGITVNGIISPASSFGTCTDCHGTGYDGGTAEQSCLNAVGCHGVGIAAPHPAIPWLSTTGGPTHSTTDTSNDVQCARCHTAGANSGRDPLPGDLLGTSGCFNNTLCHGAEGHAAGWSAAALHGAEAKKAPGVRTGLLSCQLCHGTAFSNGPASSCMNNASCHGSGVNAPHARKPWSSTTGGPTHTTTDPANAATCAICHTAGANSIVVPPSPATGTAGCYNNTLCHFHQIPFAPPTVAATLHGGLARQDLRVCQNCHGIKGTTAFDGLTLADGTRTIACSGCHTFAKAHATDWQGSGTYSHRTAGNTANACSLCHDVTQGRTPPLPAAPSCFSATFTNGLGQARTCHAGGPGAAPHAVPYNNHNATARSNLDYCLGCHQIAQNATTPPGCQNCHLISPQAQPNNCVSCHANPPNGSVYPNIAGTHAAHGTLNVADVCGQCHSGLGLATVDHLNRSRSRTTAVQANPVAFGTLAKTGGLTPTYTASNGVCANTYCHGASLTGGTNKNPAWGSTLTGCGTCHGYPPATATHSGKVPTDCISCHTHVNASGTGFTDAAKHLNGTLEAASGGHAFPYTGSSHLSTAGTTPWAACNGCHNTTATGQTYPVAAGIAPNCTACHLQGLRAPSGTSSCWDCHGVSATDGRPNGNTFPNRRGGSDGHNRGTHRVACTICHPITTGSAQHGWSNRSKSTNAQVVPGLNWNPGTRASGQGSCNPSAGGISGCHGSESSWY